MTRLSHSTRGIPQVLIDVAVAQCAALGFDGLELTVIPGWTIDTAGLEASERRHNRTVYDHWLEPCGLSVSTSMLVSDADERACKEYDATTWISGSRRRAAAAE
jgi:hypothetical protein